MDKGQFLSFIDDLCKEIKEEHKKIKKISNLKERLTESEKIFEKIDGHFFLIQTYFLQHKLEEKGVSFTECQLYYNKNINRYELLRTKNIWEHQIHLDEKKRDLSNCSICLDEWRKELDNRAKKDHKKEPQTKSNNQHFFCYGCGKNKLGSNFLNKKDDREFCSSECFLDYYAELCCWCANKCLKYEREIPAEFEAYYLDGDKNSSDFLCFSCNQKQKKELTERLEKLLREQGQNHYEMDKNKRRMKHIERGLEKNNFVIYINSNYNDIRERERESKINAFVQKLQGWISELENKDNLDEADEEHLKEKREWLEEIENLKKIHEKESELGEKENWLKENMFWVCFWVVLLTLSVVYCIHKVYKKKRK